jgi:hypothetical protein
MDGTDHGISSENSTAIVLRLKIADSIQQDAHRMAVVFIILEDPLLDGRVSGFKPPSVPLDR